MRHFDTKFDLNSTKLSEHGSFFIKDMINQTGDPNKLLQEVWETNFKIGSFKSTRTYCDRIVHEHRNSFNDAIEKHEKFNDGQVESKEFTLAEKKWGEKLIKNSDIYQKHLWYDDYIEIHDLKNDVITRKFTDRVECVYPDRIVIT